MKPEFSLEKVKELKSGGASEAEIATYFGIKRATFRKKMAKAKAEEREASFRKYYQPEANISLDRIDVKYNDDILPDGRKGSELYGIVGLRQGAKGISLEDELFGQVIVPVNGTHYFNGMGIFQEDEFFAPGTDVIFYCGKDKTGHEDKLSVMREQETRDGFDGPVVRARADTNVYQLGSLIRVEIPLLSATKVMDNDQYRLVKCSSQYAQERTLEKLDEKGYRLSSKRSLKTIKPSECTLYLLICKKDKVVKALIDDLGLIDYVRNNYEHYGKFL